VDLSKTTPGAAELGEICRKLGVTPRELLRSKDPAYEELGLAGARHPDAKLLELMSKNPGLIQRPIAVRGARAVVARPVERLAALLD
jgi:arsenate reductase